MELSHPDHPRLTCRHYGQTLAIDQMLLEYPILEESRDEYCAAASLKILFETIPGPCIVEFLGETRPLYLM